MAVSVAEQRAGDAGASLPTKRVGGDVISLESRRDGPTRVLAEAVRQLDGVVVVRRVLRRLAAQRQREDVDAVRVVGRAACARRRGGREPDARGPQPGLVPELVHEDALVAEHRGLLLARLRVLDDGQARVARGRDEAAGLAMRAVVVDGRLARGELEARDARGPTGTRGVGLFARTRARTPARTGRRRSRWTTSRSGAPRRRCRPWPRGPSSTP